MTDSASLLATAFIGALSYPQRDRLIAIVTKGGAVSYEDLEDLEMLKSLKIRKVGQSYALRPDIVALLRSALGLEPKAATAFDVISDALDQGDFKRAIEALNAHGGAFISMTGGLDHAHQIAALFPSEMENKELTLCLLHMVNALKSGDLAKADALHGKLKSNFKPPKLEDCGPQDNAEMVCALFMKAVYADEPVSDKALDRLFSTLSELPHDVVMMRGLLYNVGLDILLRRNQVAMADEAANRALFHYLKAGETGLGFYVQLYLAIIALWRGDVLKAKEQTAAARELFGQFAGASTNDELLLQSIDLICAYEAGASDKLLRHLVGKDDAIPFGELWPAMAEPIISYGRRALASESTSSAALSWVQRWRLRQWRSQRFDNIISIQEALALQDLGRWQEADEVLARISDVDGGEVQIARFASALDRQPNSEELARKIRHAIEQQDQPQRQRLLLLLLAAESATYRNAEREAVRFLRVALSEASPDMLPKFWAEQRLRLERILRNRALRNELRKQPQLQRSLSSLMHNESNDIPSALTRQEYRVLLLLAESQSNKLIAQRMGISLPTVKFHVSNLCRKTGVSNRRAVVQHAIRANWLPS